MRAGHHMRQPFQHLVQLYVEPSAETTKWLRPSHMKVPERNFSRWLVGLHGEGKFSRQILAQAPHQWFANLRIQGKAFRSARNLVCQLPICNARCLVQHSYFHMYPFVTRSGQNAFLGFLHQCLFYKAVPAILVSRKWNPQRLLYPAGCLNFDRDGVGTQIAWTASKCSCALQSALYCAGKLVRPHLKFWQQLPRRRGLLLTTRPFHIQNSTRISSSAIATSAVPKNHSLLMAVWTRGSCFPWTMCFRWYFPSSITTCQGRVLALKQLGTSKGAKGWKTVMHFWSKT